MYLTLFLFHILLISVSSVEFKEIPSEVLDGFQHINATTIAQGLVLYNNDYRDVGYDKTTCDDLVVGSRCTVYCEYFQEHADMELTEKQFKSINSTEPAYGAYDCTEKCSRSCNEQSNKHIECLRECTYLCFWQMKLSNRKEHEQEFLELMMRLKKIGAV